MPLVPQYLYDLEDSLAHGGPIRACGYLLRRRAEFLLDRKDEPIGLRRAIHSVALIEVLYRAIEDVPGLFSRELKDRLKARTTNMRLQAHEARFADSDWWRGLDREASRRELRSNLDRLLADPVTLCLAIGIEVHALFDIMMSTRYREYRSIITPDDHASSRTLACAQDEFRKMLLLGKAA